MSNFGRLWIYLRTVKGYLSKPQETLLTCDRRQ
uniref:Uncharacterized protein n=1 Tax=Rhizophora mucronata TaxID=61149 RepID=A0A2P2PNW8_RHIMU